MSSIPSALRPTVPWLTERLGQRGLNSLKRLGLYLTTEKALREWGRPRFKPEEAAQYLATRAKPKELVWLRMQALLGKLPQNQPIELEDLMQRVSRRVPRMQNITRKGEWATYGLPEEERGVLESLRPKYRESFIGVQPKTIQYEYPIYQGNRYINSIRVQPGEDPLKSFRETFSLWSFPYGKGETPLRVGPSREAIKSSFRPYHFADVKAPVLFDLRRRLGTFAGKRAQHIDEWQSTWMDKARGGENELYRLGNNYPWSRLAKIHALRLAALDPKTKYLTWGTGKSVADRYNLEKWVDKLHATKVRSGDSDEYTYSFRVRRKGSTNLEPMGPYTEKELPGLVGREAAEVIKKHAPDVSTSRPIQPDPTLYLAKSEIPLDEVRFGPLWPYRLYDEEPASFFKKLGVTPQAGEFESSKMLPDASTTGARKSLALALREERLALTRNELDRLRTLVRGSREAIQANTLGHKREIARLRQVKRDNPAEYAKGIMTRQGIRRPSWGVPLKADLRRRVLQEGFPLFILPAALAMRQQKGARR